MNTTKGELKNAPVETAAQSLRANNISQALEAFSDSAPADYDKTFLLGERGRLLFRKTLWVVRILEEMARCVNDASPL